MTKKRRGCPSRTVRPGAVVVHESRGGSLQEQIAWARGVIKALGYPCILCGDPEPGVIGRLIPDLDAVEQLEGPMASLQQGETLTLWYALCEECSSLDDAGNRVEARMQAKPGAA